MERIEIRGAEAGAGARLRAQALERIAQRRRLGAHVLVTVAADVLLALVWAIGEYHNAGGWPTGFATGRRDHDWDPWIVYPVVASVAALVAHAWVVFGRRPVTEADVQRELVRLGAE